MSYSKNIVCFANSRKLSGRCIAGKECSEDEIGSWIRPVSDRPNGEVSEEERRYEDGSDPQLLDIMDIEFLEHVPYEYQTENHRFDPQLHWEKTGEVSWDDLDEYVDTGIGALWINGHSTGAGCNDKIPEDEAFSLTSSLVLVELEEVTISVLVPGEAFGNPRRKVRAEFRYSGTTYNLTVTDPVIEREFLRKDNGRYPLGCRCYACISLGEPYNKFVYKLVASIITRERTQE